MILKSLSAVAVINFNHLGLFGNFAFSQIQAQDDFLNILKSLNSLIITIG